MDFSRVKQGEWIAGIGGLALFIFLFLDWFGAGGAEVNGWDSLAGDVTGFIVAVASIAGMKLVGLAALGQRLNIPVRRGGVTAILGWLASAIILWRAIATPEGAEIKFGLFLGLAAALAITIGAVLALRESGFEPLVAVAGGRTRAASSASAPATTTRRATSASSSSSKPKSSSSRSSSSRSKSSSARKSSSSSKSSTKKSGGSSTRRRASSK